MIRIIVQRMVLKSSRQNYSIIIDFKHPIDLNSKFQISLTSNNGYNTKANDNFQILKQTIQTR